MQQHISNISSSIFRSIKSVIYMKFQLSFYSFRADNSVAEPDHLEFDGLTAWGEVGVYMRGAGIIPSPSAVLISPRPFPHLLPPFLSLLFPYLCFLYVLSRLPFPLVLNLSISKTICSFFFNVPGIFLSLFLYFYLSLPLCTFLALSLLAISPFP